MCIWVESLSCGCLVAWFCYQLIATPGNRAAAVSWPDPYVNLLWILGHCWLGGGLSPALCLAAALSQCWPWQNLALMWRGSTKHNIVHSVSVTVLITEATLTRDAPYLARGELWDVCLEDSTELTASQRRRLYMEFKRTKALFPMHTPTYHLP